MKDWPILSPFPTILNYLSYFLLTALFNAPSNERSPWRLALKILWFVSTWPNSSKSLKSNPGNKVEPPERISSDCRLYFWSGSQLLKAEWTSCAIP